MLSLYLIKQPLDFCTSRTGIVQAIVSGFLLPCYGFLYQLIADKIARTSVLTLRGVFQALVLWALAWLSAVPLRVKQKPKQLTAQERLSELLASKNNAASSSRLPKAAIILFACVVAFGGIRLCLIFGALNLVPLAIVHTMMNATPVVVMFLSTLILDDRLTALKIIASALLLTGVGFNSNPIEAIAKALYSSNVEMAIGIGMSLLIVLFSALGSIFTKKITRFFNKIHISAAIGVSIIGFGALSCLVDDFFLEIRMDKTNHGVMTAGVSEMEAMANAHPLADLPCILKETEKFLLATEDATFLAARSNSSDYETFRDSVTTSIGAILLTDDLGALASNDEFQKRNIEADREAHARVLNETLPVVFAAMGEGNDTTMTRILSTCEKTKPPYFPSDPDVWFTAVVVAGLGTLQQYLLIAAIQNTNPTTATMIRSVSIVFSFMFTIVESRKLPEWNTWVGAVFIFGAIVFVSMEEWILANIEKRPRLMKVFGFLLRKEKKSRRKTSKNDEEDCKKKVDEKDVGGIVITCTNHDDENDEKRM